jgi:hypothetical protein
VRATETIDEHPVHQHRLERREIDPHLASSR